MSISNRRATSIIVAHMTPGEWLMEKQKRDYIISITPFGSPPVADTAVAPGFRMYIKRTGGVVWKGAPEMMVERVKMGLGKAIALSRAAMDTLGTAVDPKTGNLIPRKGLRQRELAPAVTPMTPEERRARRRVGVTKAVGLGITIPTITPPAPPA